MSLEDIEAAAAYLDLTPEEFVNRHCTLSPGRSGLVLKEQADGACEFIGADNRCGIYPARPRQCREFPWEWQVDGCPVLDRLLEESARDDSIEPEA
jgi:Fe-S-cluster containining protein